MIFKVMGVDGDGKAAMIETDINALRGKLDKVIDPYTFERIRNAFTDWEWATKQGQDYVGLREQDFAHGLFALSHLIEKLRTANLTANEQKELNNFISAFTSSFTTQTEQVS